MSKFKAFLLFAFVALLHISASAQDKTISGVILSERDGTPLSGASVLVKGTNRGSQTDANGAFSILAKKRRCFSDRSRGVWQPGSYCGQ